MSGTILENSSGKNLSILVTFLLICQIACFLIGGLISLPPASSEAILSTACLDENPEANTWFTPNCRTVDGDSQKGEQIRTLNTSILVFVIQMPLYNKNFSRWQQNLVGVLQIDMYYKARQISENIIEFTIDSRLAYRNKWDPKDNWTHYASGQEKRAIDCSCGNNYNKVDGDSYNCSTVPLFELGSLHHDYYLLNFRIPVNETESRHAEYISDIYLHVIHMNGVFTKVWLCLKTGFFVVIITILVWFCGRIIILSRTAVLLEYMLILLSGTLVFLNMPVEFLTLYYDMPYIMLFNDFRQVLFYATLLSFWLILAGEHMVIQDNGEQNTLKMYCPHLSGVLVVSLSLLVFDLYERRVQLYNPFFFIWLTPMGTDLALPFIIIRGTVACIYFIVLCYMIGKACKNISIKRSALPSMSTAQRLHYKGIIYRFYLVMLATAICAAISIISFIFSQIAEGQHKWDEDMELEVSSALFTGVYGMWNIYICAMLILYAPSHKKWPADPVSTGSGKISLQNKKPDTPPDTLDVRL